LERQIAFEQMCLDTIHFPLGELFVENESIKQFNLVKLSH